MPYIGRGKIRVLDYIKAMDWDVGCSDWTRQRTAPNARLGKCDRQTSERDICRVFHQRYIFYHDCTAYSCVFFQQELGRVPASCSASIRISLCLSARTYGGGSKSRGHMSFNDIRGLRRDEWYASIPTRLDARYNRQVTYASPQATLACTQRAAAAFIDL